MDVGLSISNSQLLRQLSFVSLSSEVKSFLNSAVRPSVKTSNCIVFLSDLSYHYYFSFYSFNFNFRSVVLSLSSEADEEDEDDGYYCFHCWGVLYK